MTKVVAEQKQKPKVKAIIFDLGGVIMSGGYLPFIQDYCLQCLTKAGKKEISRLEHEVNLGTITEQQFYQQIEKTFGIHLKPKQMHDLIVAKMKPDKELVKFIPKLKKVKTALFTNSIGPMALAVLRQRRVPVKKIFDRLFISSDIHLAKPDPQAYSYVIKKLKLKPAQALMVDDRGDNIRAAKRLGMQGLVYKNAQQFKREIKKYNLI